MKLSDTNQMYRSSNRDEQKFMKFKSFDTYTSVSELTDTCSGEFWTSTSTMCENSVTVEENTAEENVVPEKYFRSIADTSAESDVSVITPILPPVGSMTPLSSLSDLAPQQNFTFFERLRNLDAKAAEASNKDGFNQTPSVGLKTSYSPDESLGMDRKYGVERTHVPLFANNRQPNSNDIHPCFHSRQELFPMRVDSATGKKTTSEDRVSVCSRAINIALSRLPTFRALAAPHRPPIFQFNALAQQHRVGTVTSTAQPVSPAHITAKCLLGQAISHNYKPSFGQVITDTATDTATDTDIATSTTTNTTDGDIDTISMCDSISTSGESNMKGASQKPKRRYIRRGLKSGVKRRKPKVDDEGSPSPSPSPSPSSALRPKKQAKTKHNLFNTVDPYKDFFVAESFNFTHDDHVIDMFEEDDPQPVTGELSLLDFLGDDGSLLLDW